MIPLKDDNKTETYPFVTILLIVFNCLVFVWEVLSPVEISVIARLYGAIPVNLVSFTIAPEAFQPIGPVTTVFTAMFLHGNVLHLAGNMLYLWIFGGPDSLIPMVGASGAISGILGAYLILFPSARVATLVFFGLFWVIRIPALLVIGYWAFLQILNGVLSDSESQQGGVAWLAHVGGFLAGLLSVRLWLPGKKYRRF